MPSALIVEDEPEANRLLAMLVQLRGYRTDSAFTGQEALSLAQQRRPDLIFLDLMLPDTNGYEICRSLKADPGTAAIPVVMVTARLADENRVEGFRVGASDYIPKPYTPDQIFRAMAQADAWHAEVGRLDLLSVALGGGSDLAALRDLNRLRNTILARQIPTAAQSRELDRFLRGLIAVGGNWPRPHEGSAWPHLDYYRDSTSVTLSLRDLAPTIATDPGLRDLIAAGPFGRVETREDEETVVLTLRCQHDSAA